ncbi:MAG: hypothetical protein AAB583_00815, partial [Patescibacteria group bacterium]
TIEHGGDIKKAATAYAKAGQQANKSAQNVAKQTPSNISSGTKGGQQQGGGFKQFITKGNNVIRIGSHDGQPFRVAIGPSAKFYKSGEKGSSIPFHIHMDKKIGFIEFNWLKSTTKFDKKGNPLPKKWDWWGGKK